MGNTIQSDSNADGGIAGKSGKSEPIFNRKIFDSDIRRANMFDSDIGGVRKQIIPILFSGVAREFRWDHGEFFHSVNEISSDIEGDTVLNPNIVKEQEKMQEFLIENGLEVYFTNFKEKKVLFSDLSFFDPEEYDSMIEAELIKDRNDRDRFYEAIEFLKHNNQLGGSDGLGSSLGGDYESPVPKPLNQVNIAVIGAIQKVKEKTIESLKDSDGSSSEEDESDDSFDTDDEDPNNMEIKITEASIETKETLDNITIPSVDPRTPGHGVPELNIPSPDSHSSATSPGTNPLPKGKKAKPIKTPTSPRTKDVQNRDNLLKMKKYLVEQKNILVGDTIAKGAYGVVKRGIMRAGMFKLAVAIKESFLRHHGSDDKLEEEEELQEINREVRIQCELNHPNIVKCFGYFIVKDRASIVLELCVKGDLSRFLKNHDIPLRTKMDILYQIAKGMKYLHSMSIVHRDLKPRNILVKGTPGAYRVKICDFGTSKTTQNFRGTFCGTAEYLAPELYSDEMDADLSPEEIFLVDIYSFGILMWEVLSQERAFRNLRVKKLNDFQILQKIHREGIRPTLTDEPFDSYPHDLKELMTSCWDEDPEARPDSFDLVLMELGESYQHMMENGIITFDDDDD